MKVTSTSIFSLAVLARITQACVEVRCNLYNDPIAGDTLGIEVWDDAANQGIPVIKDGSNQHFASAATRWEYRGSGIFSEYFITVSNNCKHFEYRNPHYSATFDGGAEVEITNECYCVKSGEFGDCSVWLKCSEFSGCDKDDHPTCAGTPACKPEISRRFVF